MSGLPDCVTWVAATWMEYVDKRKPEMTIARNKGIRVTSPKFSGDVPGKLERFFAACPGCDQVGSPYYVDVIAFNDWVDGNDAAGGAARIKALAAQLKAKYKRPVLLAYLNTGSSSEAQEANIINSGLFDPADNPLIAVYWNVYPQSFSPPDARNRLLDIVMDGPQQGKSLGQVLVEKCGPER
mmetsp:Transcript_42497/g.109732  ORF Transcript_42497/g.109732 Transcript_42497/m.109732 type:complete len:183 (+) Transcript_42497:3-551(+)